MSRRTRAEVWGAPLALALASAAGLVSALLGDGFADAASWAALAAPVAVGGWFWLRPPRPARNSRHDATRR